jgi:hypothetical protein
MRELYGDREGEEEAEGLQREVLAFVLVEHPVPMTVSELRSELGPQANLEDAVAALIGDGLLERREEEVLPTPAALHFHLLEPIEPPRLD